MDSSDSVGNPAALRRARKVVDHPLGAVYAQPHGNMQRSFISLLGPLATYFWGRRYPHSSLPFNMLLAIDASSLYLFEATWFREPRQMETVALGTYRASASSGGVYRRLTLETPGLGAIDLDIAVAALNRRNIELIDLILSKALA